MAVILFNPNLLLASANTIHEMRLMNNFCKLLLFKIKSESAVAAGIRRIEAVTSSVALKSLNDQAQLLNDLKSMLNNMICGNQIQVMLEYQELENLLGMVRNH